MREIFLSRCFTSPELAIRGMSWKGEIYFPSEVSVREKKVKYKWSLIWNTLL